MAGKAVQSGHPDELRVHQSGILSSGQSAKEVPRNPHHRVIGDEGHALH